MSRITTAAAIGAIALLSASQAFALDATKPAADNTATNPPVSAEQTGAISNVKLESGENSFTEDQARERIEGMGFTNVSGLKLDEQGIWRGNANKGATAMTVGLDFKGNFAAQPLAQQ